MLTGRLRPRGYGVNWLFSLLCTAVFLAGVEVGPATGTRVSSALLLVLTLLLTGLRWRQLRRQRA